MIPKYPIFCPSKGRAKLASTLRFFERDKIPYKVVVEPQEAKQYADVWGLKRLQVLPFSNRGLATTRNWIVEYGKKMGYERVWMIDDNCRDWHVRYKAKRFHCNPGVCLSGCEIFTDRYENIAISGLNYSLFCPDRHKHKPYVVNHHVYSCMLVNTAMPFRFRGGAEAFNDDVDMCLQIVTSGYWCTVLLNTFLYHKKRTMLVKGGMEKWYRDNGRLKMSRSLEKLWPGIVTVKRRFGRPHFMIKNNWKSFKRPLIKKKGYIDDRKLDLKLVKKKEIKHPDLKEIFDEFEKKDFAIPSNK